jgi:hypothetical protein
MEQMVEIPLLELDHFIFWLLVEAGVVDLWLQYFLCQYRVVTVALEVVAAISMSLVDREAHLATQLRPLRGVVLAEIACLELVVLNKIFVHSLVVSFRLVSMDCQTLHYQHQQLDMVVVAQGD